MLVASGASMFSSIQADAGADSLPHLVRIIADASEPWKTFYSDSSITSIIVIFVHLAAIVIGGGLALAADRSTIRMIRTDSRPGDTATHIVATLAFTHRPVISALLVSFASGVLLFFADVETFWNSWVYWTKMGLVIALLVNASMMISAEKRLSMLRTSAVSFRRLGMHAWLSAFLWLSTLLLGVALANG